MTDRYEKLKRLLERLFQLDRPRREWEFVQDLRAYCEGCAEALEDRELSSFAT